jgi:hypothetical protein
MTITRDELHDQITDIVWGLDDGATLETQLNRITEEFPEIPSGEASKFWQIAPGLTQMGWHQLTPAEQRDRLVRWAEHHVTFIPF